MTGVMIWTMSGRSQKQKLVASLLVDLDKNGASTNWTPLSPKVGIPRADGLHQMGWATVVHETRTGGLDLRAGNPALSGWKFVASKVTVRSTPFWWFERKKQRGTRGQVGSSKR